MAKPKTLQQWLIPKLRNMSRYWPEKHKVINAAKVKVQVGVYKNGNPEFKTLMKCNCCKELFDRMEIDVDHVIPVANAEGFKDWDLYINALFCPAENLQVLCKACHLVKSIAEGEDRRKTPKKKKVKKDDDLY